MRTTRRDARAGFYDRVSRSEMIQELVGLKESGRARVYPGPLSPELTAEDCTRIAYTAFDTAEAAGRHRVRIQTDISVAPGDGADGLIEEIDGALLQLLDEQAWDYGNSRLYALADSGMPITTLPGRPLRFVRDFIIHASPR